MNMKTQIISIIACICLFVASSCQKTPEYIQVPYQCLCGSIGWQGVSHEVLGAEYILNPDSESRKYFVTSEISNELQQEVRHMNFELEIDDILITDYNIEETPLIMSIKEVDYNTAIIRKEYQATTGTVTLSPAIFGGPERVNFSLVVRQLVGGELFGPEIPFSGNFNLTVEL